MAKLVYDETGRLLFTQEMKEEYTLLMPQMLPVHFSMMQHILQSEGFKVDLLTTNTIARWVAADLDDNDHLDARSVAEVLRYAESTDRAVFLPRDVTAQAALDAMTTPGKDGSLPRAGLITEDGRKDQRPIRVIGGSDIARLMEAVDS